MAHYMKFLHFSLACSTSLLTLLPIRTSQLSESSFALLARTSPLPLNKSQIAVQFDI